MKMVFDSYDEFLAMWNTVHSGILYWRKVKQATQGKIQFYVIDTDITPYSIEECDDYIKEGCKNLMVVEDAVYNEAGDTARKDNDDNYSGIIYKFLKDE